MPLPTSRARHCAPHPIPCRLQHTLLRCWGNLCKSTVTVPSLVLATSLVARQRAVTGCPARGGAHSCSAGPMICIGSEPRVVCRQPAFVAKVTYRGALWASAACSSGLGRPAAARSLCATADEVFEVVPDRTIGLMLLSVLSPVRLIRGARVQGRGIAAGVGGQQTRRWGRCRRSRRTWRLRSLRRRRRASSRPRGWRRWATFLALASSRGGPSPPPRCSAARS